MDKKGMELKFIVGLILGIAGFIVVAVFLLNLNLGGAADDEICRQSVVTRATSPDIFQRELPLNCRAKKYCLSLGGGECEQFLEEDGVISVKIPKGEEGARMISGISANAMYDCWSMMGKGRLDIFAESDEPVESQILGALSVNTVHPKCVMCARIAVADDLIEEENILSEVDVNKYMKEELVPGSSLTYLSTFTGQVDSYPKEFNEEFGKGEGKETGEVAFVFAQIIAGDDFDKWGEATEKGAATGIALGSGLLLTPAGKIVAATVGAPVTAVGWVLVTATSTGVAYYNSNKNHELATTYCGKFDSAKDEHYGCSIVMPVDFNDDDALNQVCNGGIEGML